MEQALIFEITLAANFLEITSLMHLGCAKIGSLIKGKSIDELRETFKIEGEYTPADEQKVLEENPWFENDE